MAATVFDLEIWFDGQEEPTTLRADQRDLAAFELEYRMGIQRAIEEMPMTFYRYIGWHAARRLGKVDPGLSRDDWLKDVVSIEEPDEDEDEESNSGNPTNPAP
jgi:hypothetical protein